MATNLSLASPDVREKQLTPETMPVNAPIKLMQEMMATNLSPASSDAEEKQLTPKTMPINSLIKPKNSSQYVLQLLLLLTHTHTSRRKNIFVFGSPSLTGSKEKLYLPRVGNMSGQVNFWAFSCLTRTHHLPPTPLPNCCHLNFSTHNHTLIPSFGQD